MEFTNKLKIGKKSSKHSPIKLEWIEQVFNKPEREEILDDGCIRRYAKINGKNLRLTIKRK